LVGDVGLARRRPMPYGPSSHQNARDADIWFRLPRQKLSPRQLAEPRPLGMVRANGVIDPAHWGPAQARLLELAATAPGVDRIFVNPAIKATLCRTLPPDRRAWLGRLRPWWGHDSHFHVRLACPDDSPLCEAQRPVEDGDGCGEELADWLARPTMPAPPDRPHVQTKPLPEACRAILGR
jgi:penicillin-insensitive murein endopeptidase